MCSLRSLDSPFGTVVIPTSRKNGETWGIPCDRFIPLFDDRDILFAFGYGVAFVDPVSAEIVRDLQGLYLCETHGVEQVVGGLHVGAVGPGAAAAVEDYELVTRERLDASAEPLQGRGIG